eukprot:scaffold17242_cov126-Isochrysis_galbana.AAC.1
MQQSKRNCTPSRWCSRSQRQRNPSTEMVVAEGATGAVGAEAAARDTSAPSASAAPAVLVSASPTTAPAGASTGGGVHSTSSSCVYSSSAGTPSPADGGMSAGAEYGAGVHVPGFLENPSDLRRRSGLNICTFDGSCTGSLKACFSFPNMDSVSASFEYTSSHMDSRTTTGPSFAAERDGRAAGAGVPLPPPTPPDLITEGQLLRRIA